MARVHILIATISFVVVVLARPQSEQFQPAQVVREKNNNDGSGKYLFTYELDNRQIFSEAGQLKQIGGAQAAVKSGAYTWVAPDGTIYWVNYTADENGYHPSVGTGEAGGIGPGEDAPDYISPNALKSLVGK